MKKVTVKFSASTDNIETFVTEKFDGLDDATLASLHENIGTNITNGNIWLRHYCIEGSQAHIVYVLDDNDAVAAVQPALTLMAGLDGYVETVTEDMTFDAFSSYAATHPETEIEHARKTALDEAAK